MSQKPCTLKQGTVQGLKTLKKNPFRGEGKDIFWNYT